MGNKKIEKLSDHDFLKWVEEEVKHDIQSLTEEEKKDFQRALQLGEVLAHSKRPTPSLCKEWENIIKKIRSRKKKTITKRKSIAPSLTP